MTGDGGDQKESWAFSTRALVIWGLVVFLTGAMVGQVLMILAFVLGSELR